MGAICVRFEDPHFRGLLIQGHWLGWFMASGVKSRCTIPLTKCYPILHLPT